MNIAITGTTTNLSSVFAVSTGIESAQYAWGSNGRFDEGPVTEIWCPGTAVDTGQWKYAQKLAGWVGLQVLSKWACGRITGLSTTAGKTLTDNMLYDLLGCFPPGKEPKAFFMSKRSLFQLRASRTATNATGVPAPIPTEAAGLPIYVSSAISDKEELLV